MQKLKLQIVKSYVIQASVLDAQGAIDLSAGTEATQGQLTLAAVKDSTYSAEEDKHNSMPWQSQSGNGQYTETIRLANIKAGKGLSVNATGGIAVDIPEVPATPLQVDKAGNRMSPSTPLTAEEQAAQRQTSLDKYINTLASQPGQEWIGQLAKLAKEQPDSVKLQQVAAAAQHWDYGAAGLTQEAAAVVVIVVAYFTAGAGSSAVGTTTATAGTSTTAIGGTTLATTSTTAAGATVTAYTVTGAVINAGLSTLASQAAVTILNNKGDVGKTLEDMGKSENVKNIIAAMLTAGVMQSYLRTYNAESFAAKTMAGCVTGEMTGSGCKQGATAAAIMAGSTWINYAMRTDMVKDSETFKGVTDANDPTGKIYNNNTGQGSVGIDGSGDRLAGTRVSIMGLQDLGTMTAVTPEDPNTLWSFKGTAINSDTGRAFTLSEALAKQGGPTGGSQALLQTFAAMPVSPGGFLDRLDESFAGPHDYMGGSIQGGYDSLGNWSINNGWGAEVMAGVNIFLIAPLVIPTFMQQINLNPVTLSNTIQNGTR